MYYRYDGLKINDGWIHPEIGIIYTKSNWFDCIKDEEFLLAEFGVTRHADPVQPDYDPATQKPPQLNDIGEYDEPINYTQQEISDQEANRDISNLQGSCKDAIFVLTELVSALLANGTIKAIDFTPEVRQVYQALKAIADRVK